MGIKCFRCVTILSTTITNKIRLPSTNQHLIFEKYEINIDPWLDARTRILSYFIRQANRPYLLLVKNFSELHGPIVTIMLQADEKRFFLFLKLQTKKTFTIHFISRTLFFVLLNQKLQN